MRLHVVFKTHLDIGFTDFAREVVRRYLESYIPQAMHLAREMREAGGQERFIWTTGSWLIYQYLEQADAAGRRAMEAAIQAGDIRWHALPFTTHSEAMDAELFRAGLGLSQALDRRFGLTTIAAKMTDVPGHTRGIVPLLAEAGVRFLHIGVNPGSSAPEVPDLFRWRDAASGSEVMVMYHKGSYGACAVVEGLEDALAFAHTGDNHGPQSAAEITAGFAALRAQFPGAEVTASTLEPFAHALLGIADRLPVVEAELGDTWIHGVGSDPYKVAAYRQLLRLRTQWQAAGMPAAELAAFNRTLLLIPEHTWGLDEKNTLADYVNYSRADFARARHDDAPATEAPEACRPYLRMRTPGRPYGFRQFEASWAEQRAYLEQALTTLAPARAAEARQALAALRPTPPAMEDDTPLAAGAPLATAQFTVTFDPATGAINGLTERATGTVRADAGHLLGLVRYETFSAEDYARFHRQYNINLDTCGLWIYPDFGKPGLRPDDAAHTLVAPALRRLSHRREADADRVVAELLMPEEAHTRYGAPRRVWLSYRFPAAAPAVEVTVQWADKPASRLPEALWCSFVPRVAVPAAWRLDKLGTWISPLEVMAGGNRTLHAVGQGARYAGPDGPLTLRTLDAPLLAPGTPRLLHYDNVQPDLAGGLHANLYNNIYGTNFPMWYEEDAVFRFVLQFG